MIEPAPSSAPSAPSAPAAPSSTSRRDRLRYRFDLALSRGPSVVIGWLGLLTLAIIAVTAVVLDDEIIVVAPVSTDADLRTTTPRTRTEGTRRRPRDRDHWIRHLRREA